METPDVTLVQKLVAAITAAVGSLLTVLLVFGVLDATQVSAIGGAVAGLGAVYIAADAVIRNGRSKIAAAKVADKPFDSAVGR